MILVMSLPIYLDHNATTPLAPGVVEKMTLFLGTEFGNPSSGHATARRSGRPSPPPAPRSPVLLGRNRSGFVFTGCGSEANTLAIVNGAEPVALRSPSRVAVPPMWIGRFGIFATRRAVSELADHVAREGVGDPGELQSRHPVNG